MSSDNPSPGYNNGALTISTTAVVGAAIMGLNHLFNSNSRQEVAVPHSHSPYSNTVPSHIQNQSVKHGNAVHAMMQNDPLPIGLTGTIFANQSRSELNQLIDHTGPFESENLEAFSTICIKEMKCCFDSKNWKHMRVFLSMVELLEAALALRTQLMVHSNTGQYDTCSALIPRLKAKENEIKKQQKLIANLYEETSDKNGITEDPQPQGMFSKIMRLGRNHHDSTPQTVTESGYNSGPQKRVLRSTSSDESSAKRRIVGDITPENGKAKSLQIEIEECAKKTPSGRTACKVAGCIKVSDGKRSQYMCRKHYNESRRNDSCQQDDSSVIETDSIKQSDSQETNASWSDVNQNLCFFCFKPGNLIVCTNTQCNKPWHLACQKSLLPGSEKAEYRNVDPATFVCSECKALEQLPEDQRKAFFGDDLFLD